MTQPVAMPQQRPGMLGQILPMFGKFGSAASTVVGNKQGQQQNQGVPLSDNTSSQVPSQSPQIESSPALRKKQSIEQSPEYQIRQGQTALASMDYQKQKEYGPYLEEAMRRHQQEQQKYQQYGYNSYT